MDGFRSSFPRIIGVAMCFALVVVAAPLPVEACPTLTDVQLAVVGVHLSDDGDDDGFADTNETVSMRLTVDNESAGSVDIVLQLFTDDPELLCITQDTITIEDVEHGQVVTSTESFEFHVAGDVDRTALGLDEWDELSARFRITAVATGVFHHQASCDWQWTTRDLPVQPETFAIELDLDVQGGSGDTTFQESFEDGLGAFEIQNLDQGKSDLVSSDGYRCQYNDPSGVTCGDPPCLPDCYLGASALHADAEFWGLSGPGFSPDGGRGFTGLHSLFFGVELGSPGNWTTPLATLEAAATAQPIHLGWNGVTPHLTFKQQVSFVDNRTIGTTGISSVDRGVLMLQLADELGQPVGPWKKLTPYWNIYDTPATDEFTASCSFDPVDDGTTEDDLFDPTNPSDRHGPSSSCYPEVNFVWLGDTDEPFKPDGGWSDPPNLGRAQGPPLEGSWGIGTWVESKFDLSRYRGRNVRLRFLATTLKVGEAETWEDLYGFNPTAGDDGWWVDDVALTGALASPATVSVDDAPNDELAGLLDADDDDVPDACDNCDQAPNTEQEDFDADDLGDLCDACTDTDGDGWGNPGFPANLCPLDNCPVTSNPTQDDADGDTAGDACDDCTDTDDDGFGNPGHDANVCPLDNCPSTPNADQLNADADPAGTACDCDDSLAAVYPGAEEVNDGLDNQCPGDAGYGIVDETSDDSGFHNPSDSNEYSWTAQSGAARYRAVRASSPDFSVGCTLFPLSSATFLVDDEPVPPEVVFYYMNRAAVPNAGSWGQRSSGVERIVACSP